MTVETATKVSQLDASLPAFGDAKSEGDDHLRLIKTAVKGTLTGCDTTGVTGFNVVTQATADSSTLAANTALVDAKITAAAGSAAFPGGTAWQVMTKVNGVAAWSGFPAFAAASNIQTSYGAL